MLFLPSFHLGCTILPKQSGFSECSCDYLPLTILVPDQKGNDFTYKHYSECIPSKSMSIEVLIFLQFVSSLSLHSFSQEIFIDQLLCEVIADCLCTGFKYLATTTKRANKSFLNMCFCAQHCGI